MVQTLRHRRSISIPPRWRRPSVSTYSPLAAIENLESPPEKLEKDVMVMDEISVRKYNKVGRSGGIRVRSLPISSESDGCREIVSISNSSFYYRTETCPFWEDSGTCRFGSKCQAPICKSLDSSGGSGSYGTECHFVHHHVKAEEEALYPPLPIPMALPTLPTKVGQTSGAVGRSRILVTAFTDSDWTPLDDGIAVTFVFWFF